jgi:hypothetical protein
MPGEMMPQDADPILMRGRTDTVYNCLEKRRDMYTQRPNEREPRIEGPFAGLASIYHDSSALWTAVWHFVSSTAVAG